jgi:hypothetical protein
MRARMIHVVHVLGEHSPQVSFSEDQRMIEALPADTPKKAFADGVRSGRFSGCSQDSDTSAICDPIERLPELVIVVPDQEARPGAPRRGISFGRLNCRRATISCCRSRSFSASSSRLLRVRSAINPSRSGDTPSGRVQSRTLRSTNRKARVTLRAKAFHIVSPTMTPVLFPMRGLIRQDAGRRQPNRHTVLSGADFSAVPRRTTRLAGTVLGP